jgi:leucyl-tRNA synthetase
MELVNDASKYLVDTPEEQRDGALCARVAHDIVAMLSPICPHWAEELFHEALSFSGSIYDEPWPEFDPAKCEENTVEIAIQVNGKIRARLTVSVDAQAEEVLTLAKQQEKILPELEGKQIVKELYIPRKLVNLVVKPL